MSARPLRNGYEVVASHDVADLAADTDDRRKSDGSIAHPVFKPIHVALRATVGSPRTSSPQCWLMHRQCVSLRLLIEARSAVWRSYIQYAMPAFMVLIQT